MPIYEFHCDDCGTDFEELVMSRGGQAEVVCKQCGSNNIAKLLSGPAVRSAAGAASSAPTPKMGGGGCGGGGCGCH